MWYTACNFLFMYISTVLRYIKLFVKSWKIFRPHIYLVPQLAVNPLKFHQDFWHQKTRVPRLLCSIVRMMICLTILIEHQLVTDRRTRRQTYGHGIYSASTASSCTGNKTEWCQTDHSTAKVVDYKILPRNFTVLSLVESEKPYYCDACDHHEEQSIAWIIWVANWPWPAASPDCQFQQLILIQLWSTNLHIHESSKMSE